MTDRTAYILVTASRTLTSYHWVSNMLLDTWHDAQQDGYTSLVVVHGAAKGGDSLANQWAERRTGQGVTVHRFPADWEAPCITACRKDHRKTRAGGGTFCPSEGVYRNQRMIDHVLPFLPAVLCLALFDGPGESRGTADCARRAEGAGIPVRRLHAPARPMRPAQPTTKEQRSE